MAETVILKSSHNEEVLQFEYTIEGHLKLLQNHLYSQWTEGAFCDLELQTFDGCIPVHAWLFACFSPRIATVFNDSANGLDFKKPYTVFSLDLFTYDIVKVIVEAIYSGIIKTTLDKLGELQAALQWLEMHELVGVIKYTKDKMEKENLIAGDQKLPPDNSAKSERRKSPRNTQKSKLCTRKAAVERDPHDRLTVSLVKNMPIVMSYLKKTIRTVSDESMSSPESSPLETVKEMSTNVQPSEGILNISNSHIDNEYHPEPHCDSSPENSGEMDSSTLQTTPSTENSGVPVGNQQRRSVRKKSIKQAKVNNKKKKKKALERPSHSSEIKRNQRNQIKGQKSSRREKKSIRIDTEVSESALESMSTDNRESEEEKKKDATEALMTIGRNIVKEELPEVETLEAVNGDEVQRAILSNDFIKCDKCGLSFYSLDEYNSHIENHPTYTCEKCFLVYYSRSSLVRHARAAHLKSMHLKCSVCDFIATDDKKFGQHCAEVHEDFQAFKCLFEGCKFKTTKYRYLSRHFENHEDKDLRSCVCEKCSRTFKKYNLLASHRRSCYHVQKFLCDICGQSFNHHSSMKIHRRTMHFGEKPYSCKICLKMFSYGANLRRHMRIHENSFPYSCNICMKQFRHSNTLKLHLSKHEKVVDTSPIISQTEQSAVSTPSITAFHNQANSSLSTPNASVQLCSIPPFATSIPSVLSTMPTNDEGSQVFTMPPLMTLSSVPTDKSFALNHVSVPDGTAASFLHYDDHLSWQEAENYRLSNL